MAQPLHPLGEMGQEAGESEHHRDQRKPQGKPKDRGGLGDEKEETGPYQCDQRPEIQGAVEQGQDSDLRALVLPDKDTPPQLPDTPWGDHSQRAASQQRPQRLLNAEVAYGGN